MKALTVEELREMAGQPVWCPEEDAYGIVMCDKHGKWAGIPFLQGVWQQDEVGVEFNHNIIGRKLKCYRIEDKKEIALMKFLVVCWIWQRLEIKFYGSIQVREVDNYIAFILFYYILKGEQG
jgi:hypothetical protein